MNVIGNLVAAAGEDRLVTVNEVLHIAVECVNETDAVAGLRAEVNGGFLPPAVLLALRCVSFVGNFYDDGLERGEGRDLQKDAR